jgi:hypothetical protein
MGRGVRACQPNLVIGLINIGEGREGQPAFGTPEFCDWTIQPQRILMA